MKKVLVGAIIGIIATKLFDRYAAPAAAPYVAKCREWAAKKAADLKAKVKQAEEEAQAAAAEAE